MSTNRQIIRKRVRFQSEALSELDRLFQTT